MQGAGVRERSAGADYEGRRPYEGGDGSFAEGGEGGPAFRVRAASTRLSCRVACLLARLQGRTLSGLVTGIRSAEQFSRKYVPESWKTCRFSAAALRAVRSKRHPSMSLSLLSMSVRSAFTSFRIPNGHGPAGRLRSALGAVALRAPSAPCAHFAVDRQMTPPSHAVLLGPAALSPRLASARLSGSASRPLRPKASRAPDCGEELRAARIVYTLEP